jgi:tetratricopeptide (TPR) repeat protein
MFSSCVIVAALFFIPATPLNVQQGRNSIEGRVVTQDNSVPENIRVFLLSDGYSQLKQTYVDGSGRFQFKNLNAGDYYIEVEPAGSGYERQSQRVEVNPFTMGRRQGGAEIFRVDFVLRREKSAAKPAEKTIAMKSNGLVFYQDIPPAARAAYELGSNNLDKDPKTAEINLTEAIKIFPDYYQALELLGSAYVKHSDYDVAIPILSRAIEVNKNGWDALYALGIALVESNKRAEGIAALRRAVEINPNSVNANMRLGLELSRDEKSRVEAIRTLSSVTRMAGKQLPEAYLMLASLYSKNNQYRETAEALESYIEASPRSEQRESIKRKIEELRKKPKNPTR